MAAIIGLEAGNAGNIYEWDPLTADGSTPAVEVNGTDFCFVDKIVGGNITVIHQASLNGTDWFDLESHSHVSSGVDAHFYAAHPVRYVRATVSSIGAGESFAGSVMCN